jgi:hypothetical protein
MKYIMMSGAFSASLFALALLGCSSAPPTEHEERSETVATTQQADSVCSGYDDRPISGQWTCEQQQSLCWVYCLKSCPGAQSQSSCDPNGSGSCQCVY